MSVLTAFFFLIANNGLISGGRERKGEMVPRLLVIDDEQDFLLIYQLILEPEGYVIRLATSGSQVSRMLDIDQFHPDLTILDSHSGRYGRNEPLLRQRFGRRWTSMPRSIHMLSDQAALLELVGLSDKRNAQFAKRSGGQKQRLFIALALVHDPEVVFLDELTTRLDPQLRRVMWEMVRDMRERGRTVFLITHSMEAAERLCDRVAIIDHGRIVALDTPEPLVNDLGAESQIIFTVDGSPDLEPPRALPEVRHAQQMEDRIILAGNNGNDTLLRCIVQALPASGIRYHNIHTQRPTLDDVFLKLTGRVIRD